MRKIVTIIFASCALLFILCKAAAQDMIFVPQDYTTIQQGIDAAMDGDTVLVDTGTYVENINFKGKAITVTSKFILDHDIFYRDHTIINGSNPSQPDTASVVIFVSGEDTNSVICGFTLTGGSGTYNNHWNSIDGGGIFCKNTSTAKICYNKIIDNYLYNNDPSISMVAGGGISAESHWVIIDNNLIINNDLVADQGQAFGGGITGGFAADTCWTIISNNLIRDNDVMSEESYCWGGGIYIEGANARITGNEIKSNSVQNNQLNASGGGIGFLGHTNPVNTLIVSNNNIDSNLANGIHTLGAGIRAEKGNIQIFDNTISYNKVDAITTVNYGGGICIVDPKESSSIRNNDFVYNINTTSKGGAVYASPGTSQNDSLMIEGNLFEGDSAATGGALSAEDIKVTFFNNIFTENFAERGGAIAIAAMVDSRADYLNRIINNTFFDNEASEEGGAIHSVYGFPLIINNIFYSDTASYGSDIKIVSGDATISYSNLDTNLIEGDFTAGEGIINDDPMLSSVGYPCHIEEGSPCIDAGTPDTTGLGLPLWDMIFNFRVWDGDGDEIERIDMGAYEYDATPFPVGINDPVQGSSLSSIKCYPNPTNGISNFRFRVPDPGHITLKIYDLQGREMSTVLDKWTMAGEYEVSFDVGQLTTGIYIYRLNAIHQYKTGKIVVVK